MRNLGLLLAAAALLAAAPARARAQSACGNAALLLGNPKYQGQDKPNPYGANVKTDPPIQYRSMVFEGSRLYSNNGMEVWIADLRAGTLKRIAGEEPKSGQPKLKDGPCLSARFMNIHGMAAMPDDSLVVADAKAHAILKISQPASAACTVSYLAGTSSPMEREGMKGDEDGPGAAAKLNTPEWPTVDGEGNVYFVDSGSNKVKKIAADADHTVSTLTTLFDTKGYGYTGIAVIGAKLYVIGNTFTNALIFEVDPKSGATKKVLDAGAKAFAPLDASTAPTLSSVTTDGKALIVTGQGYVWRVTPQGKVSHIAGAGSPIEFPIGYDPAAAHPAKKQLLRFRNGDVSIIGTTTSMAWQNGVLFWRGRAEAPYIVTIGCN